MEFPWRCNVDTIAMDLKVSWEMSVQSSDRSPMSFILIRLGELVLVVLGISTILFFLSRLSGDPVALLAAPSATPEDLDGLRETLGFNDPCLSGCNPHPLYVGCAVIRQARVSEWKLMF